METRIEKVVTAGVDMSLDELRTLMEMLNGWNTHIGTKLPSGPTWEQSNMIGEFDRLYQRALL